MVDLSLMDPLTRAETETLEMLYRHQREFAVGHGIAVHANLPAALAQRATQVETEWVPCFEVPQQTARSAADDANLAGLTLDMKDLAELPKADLIANLRLIAAAYQAWITAEAAKLTLPAERLADHQDAAQRAVAGCQRAHERIAAGIDLIAADALAEAAFRFANRAMWQQRIHATFARQAPNEGLAVLQSTGSPRARMTASYRFLWRFRPISRGRTRQITGLPSFVAATLQSILLYNEITLPVYFQVTHV